MGAFLTLRQTVWRNEQEKMKNEKKRRRTGIDERTRGVEDNPSGRRSVLIFLCQPWSGNRILRRKITDSALRIGHHGNRTRRFILNYSYLYYLVSTANEQIISHPNN